jgi:hypothetical protein
MEPKPYSPEIMLISERFGSKGWRAYHRFSVDGRDWSRCPSCNRALGLTGLFGLGLAHCKHCKCVFGMRMKNHLIGGGIQQWPFVYQASLYEIVQQHTHEMRKLVLEI